MLAVIGGHTRNIGKTSVICSLIRATPHLNWTAIKITQYGHGICTKDGETCECALPDHPFALKQELDPGAHTDTSRFLAAGAVRSYWARTAQGSLGAAIPALRRIWESTTNTIVESNSLLQFVKPDVYLSVLNFGFDDFKESSLRHLDRADAIVAISDGPPVWRGVSESLWRSKRVYRVAPPDYDNADMVEWIASLTGRRGSRAGSPT
jgi:hypothetical protein